MPFTVIVRFAPFLENFERKSEQIFILFSLFWCFFTPVIMEQQGRKAEGGREAARDEVNVHYLS